MVRPCRLALLAAAFGAGCGIDSVPVAGSYPEITASLKQDLEGRVLGSVEKGELVVQAGEKDNSVVFDSHVKEFINRVVRFSEEDYQSAKVPMKLLENNLGLTIVSGEDVKALCSERAGACFKSDDNCIVMPEVNVLAFFSVFSHEYGHYLYPGNYEFPSMGNQAYFPIKAYGFSRPVGSLLVQGVFSSPGKEPLSKLTPKSVMYSRGSLFAALNLSNKGGSIEKAIGYVTHARSLSVEAQLSSRLAELSGSTPGEDYFTLWKEVLESDGFLAYLYGKQGHLELSEALELVSYLKIHNYIHNMPCLSDQKKAKAELLQAMEDFEGKKEYSNPFFRADMNVRLTEEAERKLSVYRKGNALKTGEAYALAKRIVSLNSQYPCWVADPYRCPSSVRAIRSVHVGAYDSLVRSAFSVDDEKMKDEAGYYVADFINRFYPGADFSKGEFKALERDQPATNNYLPSIAFASGMHYAVKDVNIAKRFFTAAATVSCLHKADGPSFQECVASQDAAKIALLLLSEEKDE